MNKSKEIEQKIKKWERNLNRATYAKQCDFCGGSPDDWIYSERPLNGSSLIYDKKYFALCATCAAPLRAMKSRRKQ